MELYRSQPPNQVSLSLMMLGCDMTSQETYLAKLAGTEPTIQDNQSKVTTDFVSRKVGIEDEDQDALVKVFSNPYGAVTEVP